MSSAERESDYSILRRYLGLNMDSYRVDRLTLAQIEGSYKPRVTKAEALAALERLKPTQDAA